MQYFLFFFVGNAAIILRIRLKVKVMKEYREKGSEEEISLVTNGNRTMQYQVSTSKHHISKNNVSKHHIINDCNIKINYCSHYSSSYNGY